MKTYISTFSVPMVAVVMDGLPLGSAVAQQDAPVTGSAALTLKTRIPLSNVDGRMDHMGIDVKGQRLFAAAFDHHTLEVIDLRAGRQVHTIANMVQPQGAFYDPSTNCLFVSSSGGGAVKVFDGTTLQLLQTVKLSADADNVRYDARGKHVVVGYGGESL
jgi:DNA-binding beta-propeller fold protein YncE